MTRRIVLVGDPTSHHGVVLSGSPTASIAGKAIARLGDEVSCPEHGNNKIVEGEAGYTIGGVPVALEGHHGECGCCLISTASASVG